MGIRTLEQQYVGLRAVVGRSNETALIPNSLLDAVLFEALLQVNSDFPLIGVGSFDTAANQQAYSITLPDVSTGLRDVFWMGNTVSECMSCCAVVDQIITGLRQVNDVGDYTVDEPGLISAIRYSSSAARAFTNSATIVTQPSSVRLLPVPTSVVPVYYTYLMPRFAAPADVTAPYYAAYAAYARHRLHEALSTGQGAITNVESESGIKVQTAAAKMHATASERALKEYIERRDPMIPFRFKL